MRNMPRMSHAALLDRPVQDALRTHGHRIVSGIFDHPERAVITEALHLLGQRNRTGVGMAPCQNNLTRLS